MGNYTKYGKNKRSKQSKAMKAYHAKRKLVHSSPMESTTSVNRTSEISNENITNSIIDSEIGASVNSEIACNNIKPFVNDSQEATSISSKMHTNNTSGSLSDLQQSKKSSSFAGMSNEVVKNYETEIQAIENHQLEVEIVPNQVDRSIISGNRVVDLAYVLHWALSLQVSHSRICTSGKLYVTKIRDVGLVSYVTFSCTMCNKTITKCTEEPTKTSKINNSMVWGTIISGSTYTSTKELLSIMDIPIMCNKTFMKIENDLGATWDKLLAEDMIKAGKEEYEIASQKKNVFNGYGQIAVYLDGGWSKRSYGHNYNASSGVEEAEGLEIAP